MAVVNCDARLLWAQAQQKQAGGEKVAVDPLQCWWRTSSGAIRVGEVFTLVLTCAVVENDSVKVVVDQSRLDPAAMQLPPFELVEGTHPADQRAEQRRFFQYEYRLRLINDALFGKDVKIPETRIAYRIQTRAGQGGWIEGREQAYVLPPQLIRVLALVPQDATDIREVPVSSFADIDALSFRAQALSVLGGVLIVLAILMAAVAVLKLISGYWKKKPTERQLLPDSVILRSVEQELSSIREKQLANGWTADLAVRALTNLRIVASYALQRPVNQSAVDATTNGNGSAGALVLRARGNSGRKVHVSGTITAYAVAQERKRTAAAGTEDGYRSHRLEHLENALADLTRICYGRKDPLRPLFSDEALDQTLDVVRQLRAEHTWKARALESIRSRTGEVGRRIWAR